MGRLTSKLSTMLLSDADNSCTVNTKIAINTDDVTIIAYKPWCTGPYIV